jgi:hypothetical protein
MTTRVSLHAHVATGSADCVHSAGTMQRAYARRGFGVVGVVGHDEHVHVPASERPSAVATVDGIEHGQGTGQTDPHVVEYPAHGFRFLAHPARTWPEHTAEQALEYVREHDLDGVERWSAGVVNYERSLPVLELANDDAHNPWMVGTSLMKVDAPADPRAVLEAIRAGRFRPVNRGPSTAGRLFKALVIGTGVPPVWRR